MEFDYIVIGGGMAGVSIAAELACQGSVALVEAEPQLGFHATGRSAALFLEPYGGPEIRALTRASRKFFADSGSETPLLRQRGALYLARQEQLPALDAFLASPDIARLGLARLDVGQMRQALPLLRPDYAAGGALYADAADIDVDALHRTYIRRLRAAGIRIWTSARPSAICRAGGRWQLTLGEARLGAGVLVNAAGAWADEVASQAGVDAAGLQLLKRTAVLVDLPHGVDAADWPAVMDVGEQFYAKPDGGRLLLSPADEEPSEPCDAQPDELAVAIAVDRVEAALDLAVRRVSHRWAGLRTFAADRVPVVGFDAQASNFFWFAGQGGYGIQAAPALARLGAALAAGQDCPADILGEGLDLSALAPTRLVGLAADPAMGGTGKSRPS